MYDNRSRRRRGVRIEATDEQWRAVRVAAVRAGLSVGEFLLQRGLSASVRVAVDPPQQRDAAKSNGKRPVKKKQPRPKLIHRGASDDVDRFRSAMGWTPGKKRSA